jgi:hypothetical protein
MGSVTAATATTTTETATTITMLPIPMPIETTTANANAVVAPVVVGAIAAEMIQRGRTTSASEEVCLDVLAYPIIIKAVLDKGPSDTVPQNSRGASALNAKASTGLVLSASSSHASIDSDNTSTPQMSSPDSGFKCDQPDLIRKFLSEQGQEFHPAVNGDENNSNESYDLEGPNGEDSEELMRDLDDLALIRDLGCGAKTGSLALQALREGGVEILPDTADGGALAIFIKI